MKLNSFLKTSVLALAALTISTSAFAQFRPGDDRGPGRGGGFPGRGRSNDTLRVGESLYSNQALYSRSGQFQLIMQADCNLVVYSQSRFGQQAIWSSRTDRRGFNCQAILQQDSNFVVYDGNGRAVWASTRSRFTGANALIMQDDGNLVIYAGQRAVWASR